VPRADCAVDRLGKVVAGLIPLAMAMISIVVRYALRAHRGGISLSVSRELLTGMAGARDRYSLFVSRATARSETGARAEFDGEFAAAGANSSRAVLFSGTVSNRAEAGMLPSFHRNGMKSLGVGRSQVAIDLGARGLNAAGRRARPGSAIAINALRLTWIGRNTTGRDASGERRERGSCAGRFVSP